MSQQKAISKLFFERSHFIVIGLTGRTGSGCTTAASILEESEPNFPSVDSINYRGNNFYSGLNIRRYEIASNFTQENWAPFYSIKISDLISAYLLSMKTEELAKFICHYSHKPVDISVVLNTLKEGKFDNNYVTKDYYQIIDTLLKHEKKVDIGTLEKHFIKFLKLVRKFTNDFKNELRKLENDLYISTYQAAGNSIRKLGRVVCEFEHCEFDPEKVFHLPETTNRVIKILRHKLSKALIVIDAIRNPYEARFFSERYAAFYLVSVNAPDDDRQSYLHNVHKFSIEQRERIDEIESGKNRDKYDDFIYQNVKKCIEISDIHIFNPRNEIENSNILRAQLSWYVALMKHPGLITPTSMERVMQIAYTAKTNSGCISRQVGAAITDDDNSIKAIGWNDVPSGQIPCSLRSLNGVLDNFDETEYSKFERTNKDFRNKIRVVYKSFQPLSNMLSGRNLSYCFKDIKNSVDKKGNQVHTRSLHAEENAFLQISKYGGVGMNNGKLYTTASPCELCSKKAYQIGVTEIIYIDPYPGIAREHILQTGSKIPTLIQFHGAVGKGYHLLYQPTLPYKDELSFFTDESLTAYEFKEKCTTFTNFLLEEGLLDKTTAENIYTNLDKK